MENETHASRSTARATHFYMQYGYMQQKNQRELRRDGQSPARMSHISCSDQRKSTATGQSTDHAEAICKPHRLGHGLGLASCLLRTARHSAQHGSSLAAANVHTHITHMVAHERCTKQESAMARRPIHAWPSALLVMPQFPQRNLWQHESLECRCVWRDMPTVSCWSSIIPNLGGVATSMLVRRWSRNDSSSQINERKRTKPRNGHALACPEASCHAM
jgi:hypothetical protein